ncbi:MAG: pentapeptide repeat-containing protein, partial [Microcystis sp. M122S2]|uniref:pentapeptide repeat-containing protein n=1 Tax=Microcystis sp. M122S2 TaxID=2771142 RepID=UPI002584295B
MRTGTTRINATICCKDKKHLSFSKSNDGRNLLVNKLVNVDNKAKEILQLFTDYLIVIGRIQYSGDEKKEGNFKITTKGIRDTLNKFILKGIGGRLNGGFIQDNEFPEIKIVQTLPKFSCNIFYISTNNYKINISNKVFTDLEQYDIYIITDEGHTTNIPFEDPIYIYQVINKKLQPLTIHEDLNIHDTVNKHFHHQSSISSNELAAIFKEYGFSLEEAGSFMDCCSHRHSFAQVSSYTSSSQDILKQLGINVQVNKLFTIKHLIETNQLSEIFPLIVSCSSNDLSYMKLNDINLKGRQLIDINLSYADLNKTNFSYAALLRVDLTKSHGLRESNISGIRCYEVNFTDVDLSGIRCNNKTFINCKFHTSEKLSNNLVNTNFNASDLSKSEFINQNLFNTNFNGAILNYSNLQNCNIKKAYFEDAKMSFIKLDGMDISDCKFKNVDLTNASFNNIYCATKIDFSGSTLDNLILKFKNDVDSYNDLSGSKFIKTSLLNVNLSNFNLTNCNFTNAIFSNLSAGSADIALDNEEKVYEHNIYSGDQIFTNSILQSTNFNNCNLSKISFQGLDVIDVIYQHATLIRANFSDSKIINCSFNYADLFQTNFSSCEIDSASFIFAKMYNVQFFMASIVNCDFTGQDAIEKIEVIKAQFTNTKFDHRKLDNLDFSQAIYMQTCSFDNCSLKNTNFAGLNLEGTSFKNADLEGVNFSTCYLKGCDFTGAKNIHLANFSRATLININLRNLNLTGINFSYAKLYNTQLYKSTLIGADLSEAQMYKTNLSLSSIANANLEDASIIECNMS